MIEKCISMTLGFMDRNAMLLGLTMIFVILAILVVGMIYLIIDSKRLNKALDELRKARVEIRSHAPLKAVAKLSYEERLKAEYEKRGIPWETIGKS